MAVPRFVFFSLQNKKADPLLSFSAGGALVEPSSSPSETPGRRTTPPRLLPCSFPSLPPSPNLSHLISLPPRLELTLALIRSSDRPPPPRKLFSSPFCHLLFVFRSPSCLYIPSHLLLSRPPTPTCNLPPLICRPFLQLLGKHHISFPSPLFILCCFPLLPSSKAIWRSLGPVRRPRGLVAL